ncbi:MAG: DUF599 family protein [Alphaproteobacteria bacterium]|jgi:uncharacterized membrane protein|nr:DUF599 family protein [Alphaproteobacteria bacterium]
MLQTYLYDIIAVAWLLLCWIGYTRYSERKAATGNLIGVMACHRERWMIEMLSRENRMVDIQIINSALNNATFFASTTILIMAGLFAVLGALEDVIAVVRDIPFAVTTSRALWETKVIVMVLIFMHGFFKFAWAMRQFNYCALLVGAAPNTLDPGEEELAYARGGALVASLAAKHFNHGIRTYYFGMATLSWFVHPLVLLPSALLVVLVLYRREFRSRTLRALSVGTARHG